MGFRPAVFKTAALPVRTSPPGPAYQPISASRCHRDPFHLALLPRPGAQDRPDRDCWPVSYVPFGGVVECRVAYLPLTALALLLQSPTPHTPQIGEAHRQELAGLPDSFPFGL